MCCFIQYIVLYASFCAPYNGKFDHIMMAWETSITKDGCHLKEVKGTPEEEAALEKSYAHLCALRDEVIAMGVLPPVSEWNKLNPYIK